jgi:ribosomal protein L37AE/L43A
MTYHPQRPCPTCGELLVEHDRDGIDWECRSCRTCHPTAEVIAQ